MAKNTEHVNAYPTTEQAARWSEQAEAFDMGTSEFVCAMVEAGLKKFDAVADAADADVTADQLRQQLDATRRERDRLRREVDMLQDRLADRETASVWQKIQAEPGVTQSEVVEHVRATAPERVNHHLSELLGVAIRAERRPRDERDGPPTTHYYPNGAKATGETDDETAALLRSFGVDSSGGER